LLAATLTREADCTTLISKTSKHVAELIGLNTLSSIKCYISPHCLQLPE